ncbi:MAG: methyltransferase domain-containing protein, partial [Acidimicrobiia bacterium]|nr:methyltransferase domain-containing protein [Acidimicrobiia bacterium]
HALLRSLPDPVLDIGCGPGRIVSALAAAGRPALGVDPSPAAAVEAAGRGAAVLCRSVFDRLPGARRWGAALLLDGNVGIGGDPEALLVRVRELLRPGGHAVVEVAPPGTSTSTETVRVETEGLVGPWFPWAVVGADSIPGLMAAAGLVHVGNDVGDNRWFARGVRP